VADLRNVHGCQADGCTAAATRAVDVWQGGWGWEEAGLFCQPHASLVLQANVHSDARSRAISGGGDDGTP